MQNANPIHAADLSDMGSLRNIQVSNENKTIPMLNPIKRDGHTKPLKAPSICFVAMIDP